MLTPGTWSKRPDRVRTAGARLAADSDTPIALEAPIAGHPAAGWRRWAGVAPPARRELTGDVRGSWLLIRD